jgi:hypothetical protein
MLSFSSSCGERLVTKYAEDSNSSRGHPFLLSLSAVAGQYKISITHVGKVCEASISWNNGAGIFILIQLEAYDLTDVVSDYLNSLKEYNLNNRGVDVQEEKQFITVITLQYVIYSPHIFLLKMP